MPRRNGGAPPRSFALVLCGGGGAGLAHAGVLRALAHLGYRPAALVGVSMGAVVATAYAAHPRWYRALLEADTAGFPSSLPVPERSLSSRIRSLVFSELALQDMLFGWGVGARAAPLVRERLREITRGERLEHLRPPVAVIATDLVSGERVVFREGAAADAVYASTAIAGIFPPLARDGRLLADGGYADMAPVDVAREFGVEVVVAVHPVQRDSPPRVGNGIEAMLRATDICAAGHTRLRLRRADLVLEPRFPIPIDVLDFGHKRLCVAAGCRAVRREARRIDGLLRR